MSFAPKFVDLVRNYSTTVGTSDFILGPAVNGFSSFTDACQPGDCFYYSATGIDVPAETEVGRGTLLDGGAIGRDPLSGTKTNFSSGTKSVALIAASEWFGDLEIMRASPVNVKIFGAKGDSVEDGSSGSDDTAAIQAAIDHVAGLGGGTLYFPAGYYKITSYLKLCPNLHVLGAGKRGSHLVTTAVGGGGATEGENVRNGSLFYGGWPSNASNNASVRVEHIGMISNDPANAGAALYDNCGTYVSLHDCYISGFKYGVVFDQTELSDIDRCEIRLQNAGGAAVYLVNGPTLTPGNLTTVTNRISVSRCQINEYQTAYGILDEGGYTHSFIDNNYNGCLNHIYAAGVQALQVIGGEFETCAGASIEIEYRRIADGSGVGGSSGLIMGMMNAPASQPCIHITSTSGPLSIVGNCLLRGDGKPPIAGANNAFALNLMGNTLPDGGNGELVDSYNSGSLFDSRIDMPVTTNSGLASLNLNHVYAHKMVRCTNVTANACTIQADSSALLPVGATFCLEQSAAGRVSLAAATGVTLTGPTATTGQYQRLVARKIAANKWVSQLVLQKPQAAAQADSSAADVATLTADFNALLGKLRAAGLMG